MKPSSEPFYRSQGQGEIAFRSSSAFRFPPLEKVLKRWRECWRLAALPDSKKAATSKVEPEEYIPKAGMRGKNVQWVPCSPVVLDKMLDMANVTVDDYVIDPGSGDGRIVIQAAERGARALGIEANPRLLALSRRNAEGQGGCDLAAFSAGDFFEADLSKATVVTLFLRRDLNLRLRARILNLKPGTRIVSNIFDMGDWEADRVVKVEDGGYYFRNHTVHLWIVPEKIGGLWKLPHGELAITQKFQRIEGTLTTGGTSAAIEGRLTGNRIDFSADGRRFSGHVTGNRMNIEERNGSGQPSALSLRLKRLGPKAER